MNIQTFQTITKDLAPENAKHAKQIAREIVTSVREDASKGFLLSCCAGYFMGYQAGTDGRPPVEDLHNPGLSSGGLCAFYDMGYTRALRERMPNPESSTEWRPADGRTMPKF